MQSWHRSNWSCCSHCSVLQTASNPLEREAGRPAVTWPPWVRSHWLHCLAESQLLSPLSATARLHPQSTLFIAKKSANMKFVCLCCPCCCSWMRSMLLFVRDCVPLGGAVALQQRVQKMDQREEQWILQSLLPLPCGAVGGGWSLYIPTICMSVSFLTQLRWDFGIHVHTNTQPSGTQKWKAEGCSRKTEIILHVFHSLK